MPWLTQCTGLAVRLDDVQDDLLVTQANFRMATADAAEAMTELAQAQADLAAAMAAAAAAEADLAAETSRAFLLSARIREAEILIARTDADLLTPRELYRALRTWVDTG